MQKISTRCRRRQEHYGRDSLAEESASILQIIKTLCAVAPHIKMFSYVLVVWLYFKKFPHNPVATDNVFYAPNIYMIQYSLPGSTPQLFFSALQATKAGAEAWERGYMRSRAFSLKSLYLCSIRVVV